jgi:hypothetical protein
MLVKGCLLAFDLNFVFKELPEISKLIITEDDHDIVASAMGERKGV